MRVLYFHQHFSTPAGATGIRSYEMAKKLISRGHTVTMVCGSYSGARTGFDGPFIRGKREGVVDGINVVEFKLAYSNNDSFLKRTFTFLKFSFLSMKFAFTSQYDLIFATSTPLTTALPGLVGRWFRGKPFIFEVRDLWPELPRAMGVITNPIILSMMSALEFMAYKSAHALIALSHGIKEGIVKVGVVPERVKVIPNGCDILLFSSNNQLWQPTQIEDRHFVAVYSGTHGIANGLQSVVDTAKLLKDRNCDEVKFILIGQGKLKADLMKQVDDLQLTNIIFLDAVEKTKLSQLLVRADVGLQILANVPAFYYGTSPNKFFDYIAAGLPVIINYPGWLAEKIEQSQCGKVVRPNDPKQFADLLQELSHNKAKLIPMGKAALLLAKNEFNRESQSDEFVNWLEMWSRGNVG